MSIADKLPDQDEIRAGRAAELTAQEEAASRPVAWDGEEAAIDDVGDTSFEILSDRARHASQMHPVGRFNSHGDVVDEASPTTARVNNPALPPAAPSPLSTVVHAQIPEALDDEATMPLSTNERLRQMAVSWVSLAQN